MHQYRSFLLLLTAFYYYSNKKGVLNSYEQFDQLFTALLNGSYKTKK